MIEFKIIRSLEDIKIIESNSLVNADCLEVMKFIPDKSVDMILCDLPYGITACSWDIIIPFEPLWEQYKRIIKDKGCIALFGSEPFSSYLRLSNIKEYKYDWIYEKTKVTGYFDVKKRPLNNYECISIFYTKQPTYIPQMIKAEKIYKRGFVKRHKSDCYGEEKDFTQFDSGVRYPKRVIKIQNANTKGILHPTQKPVALIEYFIKTYTVEGETVLDNCMGSGSTGEACLNTNRNFIGIEWHPLKPHDIYFNIAVNRLLDHSYVDDSKVKKIIEDNNINFVEDFI